MPFIAPIIEAGVAAFAAISTFVAATGVIGQAVIMAGVGVAASYLISALTPKPPSSVGGVNFQRQYGADVSRQVACGSVAMAGHDIYVNTFAPSNADLQQIYVLSDFYTTSLTRVSINGTWHALGTEEDPNGRGLPILDSDFSGLIWVKFNDGRQTASDNALVVSANPPERWPNTNIGLGVSYVTVFMFYDQDRNSTFPEFFFEFLGAPLYDFRKDDTVGGSGSHRFGDVTTYEYSANPILIEYNYRRGFSVNGDLFCGMDMVASDLPLDKWIAAANICDETQPDGLGRYSCSILLDCMTTHSDNIQSISVSCGSMQIDGVDGSWPLVGTDQAAVATFTDEDLIALADFKYTAKQSMSTLVNSVSGNFPDPDQQWAMVGYNPQVANDFLIIDRRTRDVNMDFPQVPLQRQAEQLAWIYLYENRFEITANVTLRPRYQVLEAGDWVTWNSKRYGTNTFMLTGTQLLSLDNDTPRNAQISLQQRDGMIYEGVTPVPIILPFPAGDPVYSSEVDSFALLPVDVQGASGIVQAAIRASWATPTDSTVVQVDVIYFPVDQPDKIIHKTVDASVTVVILAEGVVGSTLYQVQARIITNPPRTTAYNVGATVMTDQSIFPSENFTAGLEYQVTTLLTKYDDRIATLEQLVASVASNANGRQWTNKQMVQKQLMSVTGSLSASVTEALTVATDATTALASFEIDVNASLGSQSADITENATAIADINSGLVASWSLTLDVAGHISGIKQLNDGTLSTFVIDTDVFQIANPAAFGNVAQTVFTLQLVNGTEQMALRGDFLADGDITARNIITGGINAIDIIAQGSITAVSGTIGALAVQSLNIQDNAVTIPVAETRTDLIGAVNGSTLVPRQISEVSLSIDTTGLSGKAISVLMTFQGTLTGTVAEVAQEGKFLVNGSIVLSDHGDFGIPVNQMYASNIFTFTANGTVQTVSVIFQWDGFDLSGIGPLQMATRTLSALAVKR